MAFCDRCVAASYRRIDSMMSPMNSSRTGCVSNAGKKSTTPPRTQNSPCSSTGSPGENPALARRSPRSCGAISIPVLTVRPAAASRAGALRRGSSARADAMTMRTWPVASRCSARARAAATSRCSVRPRYGSTSCDGNGATARLEVGRRQPFEDAKKKARVGRELLDNGVGGRDGDHAAGLCGEMKGGRRRTEPRQTAGRPGEPGSRSGQLQQGSESERRRGADQTIMIPSYWAIG